MLACTSAPAPCYTYIMPATIRQIVTIQPGGVVELRSPELREGDQAEVTVIVMNAATGTPTAAGAGGWRRYAGAVDSGNQNAGDNARIDADLAGEHGGGSNEEP